MEETATLKIPFAKGIDGADAPALTKSMAEKLEELILAIPATQIKGGADKDLLIMQGTGAAAFKAMSGDITISNAGVTTIGALKVLTAMLADLAVTTGKLDNSAVTEGKIANAAVAAAKILNAAVETAKIKDGAVTQVKLAAAAIINTERLVDLAVTAAKIAEATITAAKIAANAVEAKHIIEQAVETAKIKDLAVTEPKLANSAVAEGKIKDAAATSRKVKPTLGRVSSTGDVALGGESKDITGTSKVITPAVASLIQVVATFRFHIAHPSAEASGSAAGYLSVDGVEQTDIAQYEFKTASNAGGTSGQATVSQNWTIALTAAAHTIKLTAEALSLAGGTAATAKFTATGYSYILFAS